MKGLAIYNLSNNISKDLILKSIYSVWMLNKGYNDMMKLEVNLDEIRKLNYDEVGEITKRLIDEANNFENITKKELIVMMAEKLEKDGFPIYEIKDKILETLTPERITREWISHNLDERFKRPKKIAAGKATAAARNAGKQAQTNTGVSGSTTVFEDPQEEREQDNDSNEGESDAESEAFPARGELPDIKPQLESESQDQQVTHTPSVNFSDKYVQHLEQQIKALNGEVGYQDCIAEVKVNKLDKTTLNRLYRASDSSNSTVTMLVDIRTNTVTSVYPDKEWNKLKKTKSK